jgi:hypothetical protein
MVKKKISKTKKPIYSYTVSLECSQWVTIYKDGKVIARSLSGKEMAEEIIQALKRGGV